MHKHLPVIKRDQSGIGIFKFNLKYSETLAWSVHSAGLEIATDTVANATNIFSLATKNSSLVAKVATRFLYDLELKE